MVKVQVADLNGVALDWTIERLLETEKPKTFGCHHNMPTCPNCHDMVMRWREDGRAKLGSAVEVPDYFLG